MKLKNKIALITGGGNGIGEAICKAFSAEGATVAVADIRLENANKVVSDIININGKAHAFEMDVSDKISVVKAVESIEKQFGPIDILVNNAGISKVIPFLDCSEELWDLIIKVNLKGAYLCSQSVLKSMQKRKSGAIINMSSQSGKAGNSNSEAYCASKFGILGLTQSLAQEFAKDGIRINAICPGIVFTSLWDEQCKDYAAKRNMKIEDVKPYLEGKIPMGRAALPEEIAKAAIFLASDDASYITGQSINLTGGSLMQ